MSGKFFSRFTAGAIALYFVGMGTSLIIDSLILMLINRLLHGVGVPLASPLHVLAIATALTIIECRYRFALRGDFKRIYEKADVSAHKLGAATFSDSLRILGQVLDLSRILSKHAGVIQNALARQDVTITQTVTSEAQSVVEGGQ